MVRLNQYPDRFSNINLENCGLLFPGTPHSGTSDADWNKCLVDIAELTFGVRSNTIVDILRPFNRSSIESQDAFANMRIIPPFFCLCESKKPKVGGTLRYISRAEYPTHIIVR